ncbi:MAG: hypothetical protein IPO14_02910 [Saprospiraceae bacterium]|nr:hypothetical protein [Saprospiraceae bacterium]
MMMYSNVIWSQIAMTVGYHYSAGKFDALNELIDRSNTKYNPSNKAWSSLKGMNGLSLGLKYRYGSFGLNGGWRYLFSIKSAKGIVETGTSNYDWQWNFQNNAYNLGLEGFISNYFSLGFDILWDGYRIKSKRSNQGSSEILWKDNIRSSTIYGSLNIPGTEIISMSIRPFVQIPITKVSMDGLATQLGLESSSTIPKFNSMTYGISIIFNNNGPQAKDTE